jgi:excisionase family DNA binding protein
MAAVESPLLTRAEACAYLKRGRTWLAEHADEIGAVRDGRTVLFRRADLDAWIERHTIRPAGAPEPMRRARPSVVVPSGRINPISGLPYGVLP